MSGKKECLACSEVFLMGPFQNYPFRASREEAVLGAALVAAGGVRCRGGYQGCFSSWSLLGFDEPFQTDLST